MSVAQCLSLDEVRHNIDRLDRLHIKIAFKHNHQIILLSIDY